MNTPARPDRALTPSVQEIAALTARLRALSAAGADADPPERAAFLADKHEVLDRITATNGSGNSDSVEDRAMIDSGSSYSAVQAAHELAGPHRSLDDARALVRGYLDEVSERVGVPVYQWGLGEADLAEIEADQTYPASVGPAPGQVAGDGSAAARDAGPTVTGLACPEREEQVLTSPPTTLVPYEAHGMEQPGYSHLDGEPLCPVMGPRGYQPADPVEIHATDLDTPPPTRQHSAGGSAADGLAGEPAGAVGHAHGAVAVEQAHHAVVQAREGSDVGDESRREQLAHWNTHDGQAAAASAGHGPTAGEW